MTWQVPGVGLIHVESCPNVAIKKLKAQAWIENLEGSASNPGAAQ
jgi:hypothetical protein